MANRRRVAVLLVALALAGPLAAGCAKARTVNTAAFDDATTTTRVKTVLINDPGIGPTIDVDTVKGVVTLSGRVKSKEQEARALELARTIRGVADVKSTLQIEP
jgi:osmotically-inducible protein OsmY